MKLVDLTAKFDNCMPLDISNWSARLKNDCDSLVLSVNIRSLRKNFNELITLLNRTTLKFSFIIINETWVDENEINAYQIDGYTFYSQSRPQKGTRSSYGRVAIYCIDTSESSLNEELTFIADKFESLFIPVKIDKEILNIGTIYRPPSGKIPTFVTEFESKILGQIPNSNTLIAGDFNLDLLKEPNQSTTQFITNMSDKNLMNVINKVTREAESASGHKSATIIDHIWSSLEISKSFTLEYPLSDHFLTGCNISIDTTSPLKTTYFYRKFSEKRMNTFKKHFNEYIRTVDFHAISDPNAQISELIGKLKELINLHLLEKLVLASLSVVHGLIGT